MSDSRFLGTVGPNNSWSPVAVFTIQALVLGLAVAGAASALLPTAIWAVCFYCLAALIAARCLALHYSHASLGLCNTITMVRVAMVTFLLGTLVSASSISPWLIFWIGTVALVLDGVDGWLARRAGLQSAFGARFDMETDAALGAALASWLLLSGTTGLEVIVLGFMRYAFVLAGGALPLLRAPLPESRRRKLICVLQIAALLCLTCPLLPETLVLPLSLSAALGLTYSFAVDIHWLMRASA